ncbi:hypothetical protein FM103_04250 [Corynebacterium xerosis]|nr:hypothetical protein FM103_04250 [Corynebacterium xerosis]
MLLRTADGVAALPRTSSFRQFLKAFCPLSVLLRLEQAPGRGQCPVTGRCRDCTTKHPT